MRPNETFVYGRDPETAKALLAACDEIGVPQFVVRPIEMGFVVPDRVWDVVEPRLMHNQKETL